MARSLADVVKEKTPRDPADRMREALKGIPRGKYESTNDLCKRTGLSLRIPAALVGEFSGHAVKVRTGYGTNRDGYMWARTPADAAKLRKALESQNG